MKNMDTTKIGYIDLCEKYKKISVFMDNSTDAHLFEELINFIQRSDIVCSVKKQKKKDALGKAEFDKITSGECDISNYISNPDIIENKKVMAVFWEKLSDDNKTGFTVFELYVIRYLILDRFNKYKNENKGELISSINEIIRNRRMQKSYEKIVV